MKTKKRFWTVFALVICASFINSCYKDDISDLDSRIESIENDSISSITHQISSINVSLTNLKEADREIKGFISSLQNTASELQRSLNYTNERIDTSYISIVKQIGELKNSTDYRLSEINMLIQYLQDKDDTLSINISALQLYVDSELADLKDSLKNEFTDTKIWAETTFATLAQYDSVTNSIAGIKTAISSINNSIIELEERINGKIATDISSAVSEMSSNLKDSIISITNAYTDAISKAKNDITAACNDSIAIAIGKCESSMKEWVNEKLNGYYTIEQTDAKADSMMIRIKAMMENQKLNFDSIISHEIECRDSIIGVVKMTVDSICSE